MRALAPYAALLDAGGEIVTATPRQARALKVALGRERAARGVAVWDAPRISALAVWLGHATRALDARPEILEDYAALRLWQLIVADSAAGAGLVGVQATAVEAARAWRLAHEWHIGLDELRPATQEEAAFRDWALEFRRRTAARGALDSARLAALVAAQPAPAGGSGAVGFHGFSELSPARAALIAALARAGRAAPELRLAGGAGPLARHEAATPEAECEAIAAWLHARLAAEPAAQLTVILPDLAARAAALARLLDDRLAPRLLAPGAPDARPYALAAAPRLADYAVVEAALGVLALGAPVLDVLDTGRLLRSPYLPADAAGRGRRARLDAELRALGPRSVPTRELVAELRRARAADAPFVAAIEAVQQLLAGRPRQSPAAWADAMQRALRIAGWPKGRALGSAEYQAAREVHDALAQFSALSGLLPPLDYAAACAEFRALVAGRPFQPDTGEPPVQVLDRLEDPGIPCDGLWVAGLTADRFPPTARATPFLPLGLQRARGVPGTSPAAALEQGRAALAGWRGCGAELVLSWPRHNGDARLLRSMLVPEAPALELPAAPPPRAVMVRAAARLEAWQDGPLPPLAPGAPLAGGVGALELQSQCPFRAGAERRLAARPLETPVTGLPRRVRGELLHAALDAFWGEVGSHAALLALGPDGRARVARGAVERALREYRRLLPRSRLVALERRWLERALLALGEVELGRPPFEVIEREAEHEICPAGHPLGTRVDRVDRLAAGGTLLIDYKSGARAPRRWAGERPDAMQLPVYAAFRDEPPVAVAIARLALAEVGFVGYGAADGLVVPQVRSLARASDPALKALDWPGLLAEWKRVATRLATEHAAGAADVDPAPGACEQCRLAALCRITHAELGTDEPADDDDG